MILTNTNRKNFESKDSGYRLLEEQSQKRVRIQYRNIKYFIDPFGQNQECIMIFETLEIIY